MAVPAALSVLLVDDETELLGEVARYLQRRGHQVRTAVSYATGQNLIDTAVAPDVLISDIAWQRRPFEPVIGDRI